MHDYKYYEEQAIIKAWKDPHFKKKLLNHPEEAMKEIGCPIPKNIHIRIYETKAEEWGIVLPASPSNPNMLSDNELRKAAGGLLWVSAPTGC